MRNIILLASLVLFFGCGGTPDPSEASSAADSAKTMLSVDLAAQDMPLLVEMGDANILGVQAPTVIWNEEIGQLEVKAGDHFGVIISEETGDMARLKTTLDRDPLQTHQIITESEDRMVYRSQFPDDALTFIHFYRIVRSGYREFVVQDDPSGSYNEADIARMVGSVRTQRPA